MAGWAGVGDSERRTRCVLVFVLVLVDGDEDVAGEIAGVATAVHVEVEAEVDAGDDGAGEGDEDGVEMGNKRTRSTGTTGPNTAKMKMT